MKVISKVQPWILLSLFSLSPTIEMAYSSALPDLAAALNISESAAQSLTSTYFLGFALGIFSLGRIADIFGRRPVILFGMILYIGASVASIFCNATEELAILRAIQAFGASVGSVVAQAMARDSYQGHQLSYIYSITSIGIAFVPALGVVIGGAIIEYLNWRYIFVFSSIVSALLLLVYIKYLPETNPYIGDARSNKYFTVLKMVATDRIVLLYAIIIGTFNGMAFGFYTEAPFIFINLFKLSPLEYGNLAFILRLTNIVGGITSIYLVKNHVSTKKIMSSGLALSLIGCSLLVVSSRLILSDLDKNLSIILILASMAIHVIGHSILVPIALRYALEDYAKVTGTAGSLFGGIYYVIVAIINFIISKIHSENITNFTLLFLLLSITCCISFYLIQKWHPLKKKYEFR